jgi:uncharacterized protein (TIGR03382 family)
MLKLAEPVTDRTPSIIRKDPVAIATSTIQVGFGVRDNNGNGGGQIRSLSTASIDCAQAGDNGITNANLMCFNAGDGNGSCYGDGGAPAFVGANKAVAGIGSGGTGNSCTNGLDVYTSIAAELAFIESVLPQNTTPPPTDDTPPPTNPDGSSEDPQDPEDETSDRKPPTVRGCSSTGGSSGVFMLGLVMLALQRATRRHHRVRD